MSITLDDKNRQNIPRWFPFSKAAKYTAIDLNGSNRNIDLSHEVDFIEKVENWKKHKSINFAVELVGSALINGIKNNNEVNNAIKFIFNNKNKISSISIEIAKAYVDVNSINGIYDLRSCSSMQNVAQRHISSIKKSLSFYPRNPVLWADLSYYYATIGQLKKSKKNMDIALALAPNNIFLLRSASRCYWHCDDPEKGLYLLRASPLTKTNPSLISSEIAISELLKKRSFFAKIGTKILNMGGFKPGFTSELKSTIGTLECSHGATKKAKALIQSSLDKPNENTVAQAEWISKILRCEFERPTDNVNCTFEADARKFMREEDYKKSFSAALEWLEFQPFSSRPAVFGSYVSSVCMMDYQASIKIIERALCADAEDITLNNNLIFANASSGNLEAAKKGLEKILKKPMDNRERATIGATSGLVCFRSGEIEQGRQLYNNAIDAFKVLDHNYSYAIAMLFWGREELLINNSEGIKIVEKAKQLAKRNNIKEISCYADLLLSRWSGTLKRDTQN